MTIFESSDGLSGSQNMKKTFVLFVSSREIRTHRTSVKNMLGVSSDSSSDSHSYIVVDHGN